MVGVPLLLCPKCFQRPRTSSVRLLWDVRAVGAVLEFLRTTRVGCTEAGRTPRRIGGRTQMERRVGQGHPRT